MVEQRELLRDRHATLRTVFEFLGVDESFWSPDFDRLHNTRQRKLLVNQRGLWIYKKGMYDLALHLAALLPDRAGRRALSLIGDEIERPVLDSALRGELASLLGEDAHRLRELTGKTFDHWSV